MNRVSAHVFGVMVVLLISRVAIASTPSAVFDTSAAAKADPLFDLATFNKLNSLTVNVDWKNADIQAVLNELSEKSQKSDPAKIGMKFSLQIPANFNAKDYHREVAITLEPDNIFEILEYMSGQTKLVPLIHKNEVIMVPGIETRLTMDPAKSNSHWEK